MAIRPSADAILASATELTKAVLALRAEPLASADHDAVLVTVERVFPYLLELVERECLPPQDG